MPARAIISYDGTANDDDAIALGKRLLPAGLTLGLAYVRHAREFDTRREELAQYDARQRLERGASMIGDTDISREIVFGPSTGAGLEQLAKAQEASLIIFGSDYRTAPGRTEPGASAQRLLEGGAIAVAVAAAGLREQPDGPIRTIAVPSAGAVNDAARQTAAALAERLGASIVEARAHPVDLIVVGSQPGGREGHITIGGDVRNELASARSSVLVLPAAMQILA